MISTIELVGEQHEIGEVLVSKIILKAHSAVQFAIFTDEQSFLPTYSEERRQLVPPFNLRSEFASIYMQLKSFLCLRDYCVFIVVFLCVGRSFCGLD